MALRKCADAESGNPGITVSIFSSKCPYRLSDFSVDLTVIIWDTFISDRIYPPHGRMGFRMCVWRWPPV